MRTRWKTIASVVKTHAKSGEVVVESVHGLPPLLAGGMEVALVPPALKTSRYHTVAHADAQGGRAQLVAFEDVASLSDTAELVGRPVLARLDDVVGFVGRAGGLVGLEEVLAGGEEQEGGDGRQEVRCVFHGVRFWAQDGENPDTPP